jgi:hypothetical protein
MRSKPWSWILVYLAATAVLVAGVAVLVRDRDDAEATDEAVELALPPLAEMPFASTVSVAGPSTVQVGQQVRLSAAGYSEAPIERVDLFDGARRVASVPGPRAASAASVSMPALSVGQHLVHVQVTDADGAVSKSAPVSVDVAPAPGEETVPVEVQADEGETIGELAERFDVEPEVLIVQPPAPAPDPAVPGDLPDPPAPLPPDTPLDAEVPAGATVVINVPPDAGADLAGGTEAAVIAPSPAASDELVVTAEVTGCSGRVRLTAANAPGAVTFFRASAGVPGWVQAGTTEGDGAVDVATPGSGTHVFFVRSGQDESAEVAVVVPPACAADLGWTGDASIVDGILTLPQSYQNVYLYLSVGGAWQRVPASQDQFIPVGVRTDVSSLLPALAGERLDLQVWRVFGDNFTTQVASGSLEVPEGQTMADVVGEPNALSLSVDGPDGPAKGIVLDSEDRILRFRWTAASPRADQIVWQVLTKPLPTSNRDLLPDGLLATGVSERTGTGAEGGTGDFTVRTNELPRRPGTTTSPTSTPSTPGSSGGGIVLLQPPLVAAGIPKLGGSAFAATVALDAAEAGQVLESIIGLPAPGDQVHVRILSVPDGSTVAAASTTIPVQLPVPQSVETSLDFRVDSVDVDAGRAPNPAYAQCVAVTTPWTATLPGYFDPPTVGMSGIPSATVKTPEERNAEVASAFYPTSRTYCPSDFPPPAACDAWYCEVYEVVVDAAGFVVSIVVQLYEVVSYAYNGVIEGVVAAIAKFNPVCLALTAADDEAGGGCEKIAGIVAETAITAALASFGLPPSLPDVDQLEAIAEGNLAALGKELLELAGIPCDSLSAPPGFGDAVNGMGSELGVPAQAGAVLDDPCLAVAGMMVRAVLDEAEAAATQTVAAAAGVPAFSGIDGFTMVPDPRGQSEPMVVTVAASLAQETADGTGAVCAVRAGNPDDLSSYRVGPFSRQSFSLVEADPIDGRGRWTGSVVLPVNVGQPNPVGALQGAVFEVGVRSVHPSVCDVPLTRTTAAVAPFDP